MLGIIIQGGILIAVLAPLTGEDFTDFDVWDYLKAGGLSFGTSLLGGVLAVGLATFLPSVLAAVFAMALAAVALGFAIAWLYDLTVPRAMLASGIFFLVGILINLAFSGLAG